MLERVCEEQEMTISDKIFELIRERVMSQKEFTEGT